MATGQTGDRGEEGQSGEKVEEGESSGDRAEGTGAGGGLASGDKADRRQVGVTLGGRRELTLSWFFDPTSDPSVQMAPKLPKLEDELGEDRISQMHVLVRILSLLNDTVLAVQTTILSKRWNNLCTSISSIRLDDFDLECDDHFMTFVDSVVSLHA
ncbi:hypothetical protein ACLB2K_029611 [Fragaria x ananassa]